MTEDLKLKILNGLSLLLEKRFNKEEAAKLRIKNMHDYILIACPYCGDSLKISSKKRGTVYINTYQYKCFNCGTYKRLDNFFKDFDIDIEDPSFKTNAIKYSKTHSNNDKIENYSKYNTTLKDYYKDYFVFELSKIIEKESLIKAIKVPFVKQYLIDIRKIPIEKVNKYFYYSYNEDCIFILNIIDYNDKEYVLSITKHYLNNKNKKYIIISYSKLLEKYNINLTNNKNYNKFVKLTSYFNLFNINFLRPIYVVEGLIDSMFLENSIALSGVTKSIEFLDSSNIYYIFDNDEIGIKTAKEKIKNGNKVFLWKKYLTETDLIKYNIKDINDIYKIVEKYNIEKEKVRIDENSHFSKSNLDIFNLS